MLKNKALDCKSWAFFFVFTCLGCYLSNLYPIFTYGFIYNCILISVSRFNNLCKKPKTRFNKLYSVFLVVDLDIPPSLGNK